MSGGTQTDTSVLPCRSCASPVFDDELFCESCGARVAGEPATPTAGVARRSEEREDHDLGVVAAVTDRGHLRRRNEDAVAIATVDDRFVAVVCDGVASTANPHLAARAAADAVLAVLQPSLHLPQWPDAAALRQLMSEAFAAAQAAVTLVPDYEPRGRDLAPSTTLVAALASAERVVVGNVGDSRAYWLSSTPSSSRVLTVDDSWAQEQIAEGVVPEVAYAGSEAHTITRWIGGDAESVAPAFSELRVTEPGLLVLCTDGLWNYFEDVERLSDLIPRAPSSPVDIARQFTDAALDAGGRDNISVVVLPLGATLPVGPIGMKPIGMKEE
jgi:PPM family protein phosphatase